MSIFSLRYTAGRVRHIDVARGLTILSVVLYHIYHGPWDIALNMMFMPVFALMSGIFLRPERSPRAFFSNKWRTLLVPLLVFALLSAIWYVAHRGVPDWIYSWQKIKFAMRAPCIHIGNSPLWFIVALFYMYVVAYTVERHVSRTAVKWLIYIGLSVLAVIMVPIYWPPFYLLQAGMLLPFFCIGYHGRRLWLAERLPKDLVIPSAVVFILICLYAYIHEDREITNIHQMKWSGDYITSLLAGLSGSVCILWIAQQLSRLKGSGVLAAFGADSLLVLLIHHPIVNAPGIGSRFHSLYDTPWIVPVALCSFGVIAYVSLVSGRLFRKAFPGVFAAQPRKTAAQPA